MVPTVTPMSPAEVDLAIEWAAGEGWNPGINDANCFRTADPNGFFVAQLDGHPVGSISAVKYSDSFGFLGLYIVRPEFRGRGIGKQLWKTAMEYLQGCNIGLDGVVEQQRKYRKSGFSLAYRNIRFEGVTGGSGNSAESCVELNAIPFEEIRSFDRTCFPESRDAFLSDWSGRKEHVARGILRSGRLAGYGVIRPCRSGFKIGPLFAESNRDAESLFQALLREVPAEKPFYLDIPEPNPCAKDLVERHGMKPVFETARMYTGEFPQVALHRVFGVTTFEQG